MEDPKEGSSPPPNSSEDRARVTAETVEQAKLERESAYISLMDEMEKSVGQKGQYFVKFGSKNKGINGTTDTRALLLIKSTVDPKDSSNLFIVITREGPKGLRLVPQDKNPQGQDEQGEAKMKTIIQRKLERKLSDLEVGETDPSAGFQDDGRLLLYHLGDGFRFPSDNGDTEMRTVDIQTVRTTIDESQRAAEVPHFLQFQREQQGLADAKGLMSVINNLPPK